MTHAGSDEELMNLVKAGDTGAYTTLFSRYQRPLYGYICRMVTRPELADELFQETFWNVHRFRDGFDDRQGTFRSWLYRIATNLIRDRHRSQTRRPELLEPEESSFSQANPADPALRVALLRALTELPDTLREAFYLGAVEGLDHNEVALALTISPDNARARITRARQRLRELLEVT